MFLIFQTTFIESAKIVFLLLILSALPSSVAQAQAPHDWLWNGKPEKAMLQLKSDPSWIHKRDSDRRTPLHVAARFGHVEIVKWLLDNGADVNAQAYNRFTSLHLTSDPEVVRLILVQNPDLSLRSVSGTPLQDAMEDLRYLTGEKRKRLAKIVDLYLAHDPEIDIVSAIRLDRIDMVEKILKEDSSLAHRYQNRTPLREAAKYGAFDICHYLIVEHSVDVNDFEGGTGFPIIKSALKFPRIVKLLIDHDVDLDTPITWQGGRSGLWIIGDQATVLHFAACDGVPETVKLLIDAGVDFPVNTVELGREQTEQTAIDVAAIFGRTDNLEALLSHPDYLAAVKRSEGLLDRVLAEAVSPLPGILATERQDPVRMVELLIQAGGDPRSMVKGETLIQIAAARIHPGEAAENQNFKAVAALLLQSGVEMDLYSAVALANLVELKRILKEDKSKVNARRGDGFPALHLAAAMNRLDIINLLLDCDADVNIRNESDHFGTKGATALDAAAFWENPDVARLLIKRGANVNTVDERGNTPLHSAVERDHIEIATLLLENSANSKVRNHDGNTPVDIANSQPMKNFLKAPNSGH